MNRKTRKWLIYTIKMHEACPHMSKFHRGAQRSHEMIILKTAQKLKSYPKSAQKSH